MEVDLKTKIAKFTSTTDKLLRAEKLNMTDFWELDRGFKFDQDRDQYNRICLTIKAAELNVSQPAFDPKVMMLARARSDKRQKFNEDMLAMMPKNDENQE